MGSEIGWVDIALAAFLGLSVIVGLVRGFVFELLSLAGWFAAYFAALWLAPAAQAWITLGTPGSGLHRGAAFAAVFIVALVVWSLAARLVRALIRATPLSLFDRVLGAAFGFARGVLVLLVVATVVGLLPWGQSAAWQRSQGAGWLNLVLHQLRPLFTNDVTQPPTA